MFVTSHDGLRLHVRVDGPADGAPVVLSHYLGGAMGCFEQQLPALAGRRVIRFDTRGHGESGTLDKPYSVDDLGRDALAILAELSIDKADFIGVSQGGMTGMWLATNHPDRIGRLVLANTTAFIPNKDVWNDLAARARREGMADIARETITGWVSEGFRANQPSRLDDLIADMAGMTVEGYAGNTCVLRDVDLRDALPNIAAPTLVIGGTEDGPRSLSVPVLANAVQNGASRMIEGAAHLSHIENADAFNDAIRSHLML